MAEGCAGGSSYGLGAEQLGRIVEARVGDPSAIARAAAGRRRPASLLNGQGRLMVIAADHPARGALRAGDRPLAMGDRRELLARICVALSRPGVNGFLGTPDLVEDLLLLDALDGKVVIGSMNRAGLAGAAFEMDDRFTAYDAPGIDAGGLEGGKMLLRIDPQDPATPRTLEGCARAVAALAAAARMAMIEPFICRRDQGGIHNDLSPDAMVRAMAIAAGLGPTSAYTWLKVPVIEDMERVMAATTLPSLILGGEVVADQDAAFASWQKALQIPTVRGLVVGRSLLYPPDDDVAAAVDTAVGL